jgi:predicted permease
MVGSTTTPLSMIVIGSMLASSDLKNIFNGFTVYYAAAIRLILIPAVVFIVLRLLGSEGMLLGIPVLVSGMPAAANTAIMAEKFDADSMFASKCIFISTLFSIITIPLMLFFL